MKEHAGSIGNEEDDGGNFLRGPHAGQTTFGGHSTKWLERYFESKRNYQFIDTPDSTHRIVPVILWDSVDELLLPVACHGSVITNDGRILVVAGKTLSDVLVDTVMIGDITGDSIGWVESTHLPTVLQQHTISLLPDGRILCLGGHDAVTQDNVNAVFFGTIAGDEISWVSGSPLPDDRYYHTTTVLPDGRILVIGGNNESGVLGNIFGTIVGDEISWVSASPLPDGGRQSHATILLKDGRVLVTCGQNPAYAKTDTTWFGTIDGDEISWASGTVFPDTNYYHTISLLPDGRVLLIGGFRAAISREIYIGDIIGNNITWTRTSDLPISLCWQTAHILLDGRIMTIGGRSPAYENKVFLGTMYIE